MVLSATFSDVATVKSMLTGIGTGCTDAQIMEFICWYEGKARADYKLDSTFTWSAAKFLHEVLRMYVSAGAAQICVNASQSANSLQALTQALDLFETIKNEADKTLRENIPFLKVGSI